MNGCSCDSFALRGFVTWGNWVLTFGDKRSILFTLLDEIYFREHFERKVV